MRGTTLTPLHLATDRQSINMATFHEQYYLSQCASDMEFLKDEITVKVVTRGADQTEAWVNDFIQGLKKQLKYSDEQWAQLRQTLQFTIEEAKTFPNRVYDSDPYQLEPYCPGCTKERSEVDISLGPSQDVSDPISDGDDSEWEVVFCN